jgi:hypothetical protein
MSVMKLRILIAFAIGYLLGSKAGRDRYEQLRRAYRRAGSNERIRKVIDHGKDIVDSGTAQVRGMAADQLRNAGNTIRNRAAEQS